MNLEDFERLVLARQSCRAFDSTAVEPEKLQSIMDAALLSPSARNTQPWKFSVLSEKAAKATANSFVRHGINVFVENCPAFIVCQEDKSLIGSNISKRFEEKQFIAIDTGIICAHILLAAKASGLDTCILGMFNEDDLKELLGTKDKIHLVIAIGYAAKDYGLRKKSRRLPKPVQYLTKQNN